MTEPLTDAQLQDRLSPEHLAMLRASGISDSVIHERGYRTIRGKTALKEAGNFTPAQQRTPGLFVPRWTVDGKQDGGQFRPDSPRARDGKPVNEII